MRVFVCFNCGNPCILGISHSDKQPACCPFHEASNGPNWYEAHPVADRRTEQTSEIIECP